MLWCAWRKFRQGALGPPPVADCGVRRQFGGALNTVVGDLTDPSASAQYPSLGGLPCQKILSRAIRRPSKVRWPLRQQWTCSKEGGRNRLLSMTSDKRPGRVGSRTPTRQGRLYGVLRVGRHQPQLLGRRSRDRRVIPAWPAAVRRPCESTPAHLGHDIGGCADSRCGLPRGFICRPRTLTPGVSRQPR